MVILNIEISEIDDNIGNTAEELSLWLDNSLYSRRSKKMIENHNYNNIIQDCLRYSINEIQKTAEVVGCIFEKTTIIIPNKINHESHDYTVIGIYKKAFKKTQNIKTIQFSVDSELITIGERAFYHSQIECISIPVNLHEIHEEAFFNCEKLHEINIPINSKLKEIKSESNQLKSYLNECNKSEENRKKLKSISHLIQNSNFLAKMHFSAVLLNPLIFLLR